MKNDVEENRPKGGDFDSRMGSLDAEIANLDARIEKNKAEMERNNARLTLKIAEMCRRNKKGQLRGG